jgi:hypothetical protein
MPAIFHGFGARMRPAGSTVIKRQRRPLISHKRSRGANAATAANPVPIIRHSAQKTAGAGTAAPAV